MRTIGLIGGMSWESSLEYYRLINQAVKARLGGFHSAKLVMHSVDFAEIEACQSENRWADAAALLADSAMRLERAGADCVVLCTNTMHKVTESIEAAISIPFLHIADATGAQIRVAGLHTVGLLGTRYTMEQDFYAGRLTQRFGLNVLIPDADDRATVNRIIYDELVMGQIRAESKAEYQRVIDALVTRGAQGIIAGCTEIGLLIKADDCPVPLFDTTFIHVSAAVEWSLEAVTR